ncbi:hypothetical protein HDU96_007168 [Phlyctochytrium bullatum]|nr:hypothetical protein HDU96_007168 [Phlyctochytrium bullatum]
MSNLDTDEVDASPLHHLRLFPIVRQAPPSSAPATTNANANDSQDCGVVAAALPPALGIPAQGCCAIGNGGSNATTTSSAAAIKGVVIECTDGRITTFAIQVRPDVLQGLPVPKPLFTLPRLQVLALFGNQLVGEIPRDVANASALVNLDLSFNRLEGNVPDEVFGMPRLARLSLNDNRVGGGLAAESVSRWTGLTALYIQNNQMSGPLPPELGQLPGIQELDVSGNFFNGSLAMAFSRISRRRKINNNCFYVDAIGNATAYTSTLMRPAADCNYFYAHLNPSSPVSPTSPPPSTDRPSPAPTTLTLRAASIDSSPLQRPVPPAAWAILAIVAFLAVVAAAVALAVCITRHRRRRRRGDTDLKPKDPAWHRIRRWVNAEDDPAVPPHTATEEPAAADAVVEVAPEPKEDGKLHPESLDDDDMGVCAGSVDDDSDDPERTLPWVRSTAHPDATSSPASADTLCIASASSSPSFPSFAHPPEDWIAPDPLRPDTPASTLWGSVGRSRRRVARKPSTLSRGLVGDDDATIGEAEGVGAEEEERTETPASSAPSSPATVGGSLKKRRRVRRKASELGRGEAVIPPEDEVVPPHGVDVERELSKGSKVDAGTNTPRVAARGGVEEGAVGETTGFLVVEEEEVGKGPRSSLMEHVLRAGGV